MSFPDAPVPPLDERDVDPDPIVQFGRWWEDAARVVAAPEAMALATADGAGRPSARMVLLKAWGADGFVFYTNYESRKGRELAANPQAALLFHWEPLGRQVRIEGNVDPDSGHRVGRLLRHPGAGKPQSVPAPPTRASRSPTGPPSRRRPTPSGGSSGPTSRDRPGGVATGWYPKPSSSGSTGHDRLHDRVAYQRADRRMAGGAAAALTVGRARHPAPRLVRTGRRYRRAMADADPDTLVSDRIDQLLDELDPKSAPVEKFRTRQFELGLAWVSFPEGWGGLGLAPEPPARGRPPPGRGRGPADRRPRVLRAHHGRPHRGHPRLRGAQAAAARPHLHRRGGRGASCSASPVPGRTWPDWPPGPCATATSG